MEKEKETPKETGTWYRSLLAGRSKAEFYKNFLSIATRITTEYFGEEETKRVLKAIETKRIQIPGIESFLFDPNDIHDPSLQLYNTCKSVEEFVIKSFAHFKKKSEMGETNIFIRDFFLVLADILKEKELYPDTFIRSTLKNFITSFITVMERTPYCFVMIEPHWAEEIGEKLGLNTRRYKVICRYLLEITEELMNQVIDIRACLPDIKIIYPVYHDIRDNQITYLISLFRVADRPFTVKKAVENVDMSTDNPQLRSALEYLRDYSNLPFLEIDPIVLKLQELGESTYLKRYPSKNSLTKVFRIQEMPKNYYNKFNISPIFTYKETFEKNFVPYFCDVHIDCADLDWENIESLIDAAKTINLVKGYYAKTKRDMDSLTFKITLLNVKYVTKEFTDFIQNKLKRIHSFNNRNFIMEILFDRKIVNKKIPEDTIKYFRVISDIHADYNKEHSYVFNFSNDFILNCGDTAGNAIEVGHWVRNYMRRGILVIGNHFGYSSAHPERDGIQNMERYGNTKHVSNTKREQLKELWNLLDNNSAHFLCNSYTEYEGIIIVGTCLYTDFKLYGEARMEECMAYAKKYMNDFRLPVVLDNQYYTRDKHGRWWPNTRKFSESKVKTFDVSEHAFYFQHSFEYIKRIVEENKHKPIIVVTHHAPSPYSIDEKYKGDILNAAFASNLNQYIVEHPQIRLWAHGHMHTPSDYILGETRVVCCPFGYNNENNFNLPYEYGLRIPIEDIKSNKPWKKILTKEISNGTIQVYDS